MCGEDFNHSLRTKAITMPIDKFGRHMLRAEPYPTFTLNADSTPFYICEPTKLYTPCIITIRGEIKKSKSIAFYELENNELKYSIPVSGIIKGINIEPKITIFLNGASYEWEKLLGGKVEKGDTLSFALGSKPKLYIELILSCSLRRNDDL